MGLWSIVKNVATLGGAYRLDRARDRYASCHVRYERMVASLNVVNAEIDAATVRLRAAFGKTKKRLRFADSLLNPPCVAKSRKLTDVHQETAPRTGGTALTVFRRELGAGSSGLAVAGATVGTSAALIAWQGVQLLGVASTGTAIGGIYGAAASNAGWAAFGGGSLATGGGGMAAGHLVLPGVGAVIAVGFAAYSTHSKASVLNNYSNELDAASEKNGLVLAQTRTEKDKLLRAEVLFQNADRVLAAAEQRAKSKLRRFGWISVLYRFLRYKASGVYYTLEELSYVQELEKAVQEFLIKFGVTGSRI